MNGEQRQHSHQEAEQAVLGAVLMSGSTALALVGEEAVRASDFYLDRHQLIFGAMLELQQEGMPVDTLTVQERLAKSGLLEKAGGRAAIDMLSGVVPQLGNLRGYCQIVREKAAWRARQRAAGLAWERALVEDLDGFSAAVGQADNADEAPVSEVDPASDFLRWYEFEPVGWPTPFEKLTNAIGGGLVPGDVTVISGWPKHGKSVLADQFRLCANSAGASTHLYLSEMMPALRTARFVSGEANIPMAAIMKRLMTDAQKTKARAALEKLPDKYDRIEGWDVERICRLIRRRGDDLAVIDTATRIPARDAQEVKYVSGTLTDVARETGTHLILVLQLNLERAKQPKRPSPTGRDLLGGGAWFQDLRNLIFVHREQVETSDGRVKLRRAGYVDLDAATHGNADDGFLNVSFMPSKMSFVQVADDKAQGEVSATESTTNGPAPQYSSQVDEQGEPMAF